MPATASSMQWWPALAAAGLVSGSAFAAQSPSADPEAVQSAVRHLRDVSISYRDGRHLLLLSSLRQLHDPATRPLFERLLQHSEWQVQVHAVLALTEIAPSKRLDPWLLRQVDQAAQEAIVTNAVDLGMLDVETIRELLAWEELDDLSRLLLSGELVLAGEEPDRAALRRLSGSANLRLAGLASCLLAQLGDAGLFSAFADRLDGVPASSRRGHVLWLIEAMRQYRLTVAASWIESQLDDPQISPLVAARGVVTLLQLDAARGAAVWMRQLGDDPSLVDQVKMAMLLLESESVPPPGTFDLLTGTDPLIRAIVDAGRAAASDADPSDALIRLVDLGQMRSAAWAMRRAERLAPSAAARLYAHLVDHVQDHRYARSDWADMSVTATGRLFEIDPDAVITRLASAEDDGLQQQTMLLGLLDSDSPRAGEAALGVRRIGAGQADSLALLLIAKHSATLTSDDLDQLALVVRGGGRVSEVRQAQAAWLYLRHTDLVELALSEIFDRPAGP
ncbi:MAG: hypothetical protein ACYTGG_10760 [Planctomycetota bacterium]